MQSSHGKELEKSLMSLRVEDNLALQPDSTAENAQMFTFEWSLQSTQKVTHLSQFPHLALNLSVMLSGSAIPSVSDTPALECLRQGTRNSTAAKES